MSRNELFLWLIINQCSFINRGLEYNQGLALKECIKRPKNKDGPHICWRPAQCALCTGQSASWSPERCRRPPRRGNGTSDHTPPHSTWWMLQGAYNMHNAIKEESQHSWWDTDKAVVMLKHVKRGPSIILNTTETSHALTARHIINIQA